MIVHILITRYYDGSGTQIVGATTSDAVAQAFCAGGAEASAVAESYKVDTEDLIRTTLNAHKPETLE